MSSPSPIAPPASRPNPLPSELELPGRAHIATCAPEEARRLAAAPDERGFWLSPKEESVFSSLRVEKRRLDWLGGRIAAKRALSRHFQGLPGRNPDPALLELANDPHGSPLCLAPYCPHISISHCALGAVCALACGGRRVGIDWEVTSAREPGLERMFARPGEPIGGPDRDQDLTRLWAAKEAVAKLLGLGLNCPPLDLEIRPVLRLHGRAQARWDELGRPGIELETRDGCGCAAALAYTEEP